MLPLALRCPVYDLDNRLLLNAGTVLTEDVMNSLIASNKDATYEAHPLLSHGSIRTDLHSFLTPRPFQEIFTGHEIIEEVIGTMEHISLISPFFRVLDYFKQHDPFTYRHILVVNALSGLLSKDLLPDAGEGSGSSPAGYIHDIGKINIPLQILNKEAPLTPNERDLTLHHTISGHVLSCYYLGDPRAIMAVIERDHHERRNGSGHPRGILLNDPLVEIIAVCDVYDALVSSRPYRPVSYENRAALEMITGMAEREEISWDVTQALVARNRTKKIHYTKMKISSQKRGVSPSGNNYGITTREKEGNAGPRKKKKKDEHTQ
jgi:HD-GYP domain-containing protein (c-di-GMP phosphodiesterase class II)